jgi:hypothetical protein
VDGELRRNAALVEGKPLRRIGPAGRLGLFTGE